MINTDRRTDKRKLIGAFRDYVTALEKVNLSLFLHITPVGNEAASIYKLSTKWSPEIIFARSLQVYTGPRGSRSAVFRPQRGYSLGRHPKYLLERPVIKIRPVNLFLYMKMENVRSRHEFARFEVLIEVTMKVQVLRYMTPCLLVNSYRIF